MCDKLGLPDVDPSAKPEDLLRPAGTQNQSKMDAETVEPATPPPPAKGLNAQSPFTPEQQALESLADRAMAEVDLRSNEALLLQAVMRGNSYEEVVANLIDLYPQLQADDLQDTIARSLVAAELFGRYVVQGAGDAHS